MTEKNKSKHKIGIISDTHGNLSEKCLDIFSDVDAILHAGDIGGMHVIETLEQIAPVYAVKGNMDFGEIGVRFPATDVIELFGNLFFLMHEPFRLDIDPVAAKIGCVIYGHTHLPDITEKKGVIFLNPGSASIPKAGMNPSVAICHIEGNKLSPRIIYF